MCAANQTHAAQHDHGDRAAPSRDAQRPDATARGAPSPVAHARSAAGAQQREHRHRRPAGRRATGRKLSAACSISMPRPSTARAAPCGLRPAHESRRPVGVDEVVGECAPARTPRRPRPVVRRSDATPTLVELITTSKRCPASAPGAIAATGPIGANAARELVAPSHACGWRPRARVAGVEQRTEDAARRAARAEHQDVAAAQRRRRGCPSRSRTSPAPSVLSPYQRVVRRSVSVLTAPASRRAARMRAARRTPRA